MFIITGSKKIDGLFSSCEERLKKMEDKLNGHLKEFYALKDLCEHQADIINELKKQMDLQHSASCEKEELKCESFNREGYFGLNRSSMFVDLTACINAKAAFSVSPCGEGKDVCFEVCNLQRISSYDGILDAIEIESGSCTLAEAKNFRNVCAGTASFEEDGVWHIKRKNIVHLYA